MMEAAEDAEVNEEGEGTMFKKDITWQDREFDFADEQNITFDSSIIQKIQYSVKRYQQAPVDCCEVHFTFLDAEGNELAVLKSHDVPEDAVVQSYTSDMYKEDSETLQPSEMIIGAKINQDHKGANASVQFLIAQVDPAKRKTGMCS